MARRLTPQENVPLGVLLLTHEDEAWRYAASCAFVSPDIFFRETDKESLALARSYCANCPVQSDCLEYAIKTETQDGIWGGLTYKERKRTVRPHG